MSSEKTFISVNQALPDTPAPKRTLGFADVQSTHITIRPPHLLFSPPTRHPDLPSIHIIIQSDSGYASDPFMPQSGAAADDHTLTTYGDISHSELIDPPLPPPPPPTPNYTPLQPSIPRSHLELESMLRCRYGALASSVIAEELDLDEHRWPGNPRLAPRIPTEASDIPSS